MSIFEQARRGELLGDKIRRLSSTSLDSEDPKTGLTLLATAVLSGAPEQVEQLLERGATANKLCKNKETPLLLATWKARVERPLMVQALLPYLDKKSLNHTCRAAEGNTPIMWAVEKADADSVRLLAKAGAKIKIKNEDGETAEDIALRIGKRHLINCLRPVEEQTLFTRVATGVARFGRHIVSVVEKKFSGAMSRVFKFKGEKHDSVEARMKEMRTRPAKPTADKLVSPAKPMADKFVSPAKPMADKSVDQAKPTAAKFASPAEPIADKIISPATPAVDKIVSPAEPKADEPVNPVKPTVDSVEAKMEEMRASPAEPKADEFVQQVDEYVKSTPTLSTFFKEDKRFMQDMAAKLVNLAKDTTTDLASPEVLPMTIEVTMHQQVIYCDDSSSMTNYKGTREKRWENQKELARHIAKIGTLILPDDQGVALRFINQRTDDESANLDLEGLGRGLESISPRGDTPIGTTLHERILKPLVLQPLAEGRFKRPLLVSILTDGGPSGEDAGKLATVILECGNELVAKGYPRDCVKFLVGQVGSSLEAVRFLDTLRGNSDIDKVTYVFAGRLDDKFKSFRDQRALDRWLVTTLYQPLANAARKKA